MEYLMLETELGWLAASWWEQKVAALVLPRKTKAKAVNELKNMIQEPIRLSIYPKLAEQLRQYFCRQKVSFSVPLDLSWATQFQKKVYQVAMTIPFGEVRSYGWIAGKIGNPEGARAVGQALGKNRIPLIIPCHRVLRGDGTLGGFSGGVGLKEKLLEWEGIENCRLEKYSRLGSYVFNIKL